MIALGTTPDRSSDEDVALGDGELVRGEVATAHLGLHGSDSGEWGHFGDRQDAGKGG
ncbi:hypothetical protein BQ8794_240158 [Mesorhizobium prunaredense]|uniref:Uncharacterized protein n=1 Tax=Mesorhizobium prunaredense TaxID=1631249 RepID=A0A1R3V9M0_9HYPH|nr:hypothetical protein BQ8794_240158 [Mesorhizobium prunaredense]